MTAKEGAAFPNCWLLLFDYIPKYRIMVPISRTSTVYMLKKYYLKQNSFLSQRGGGSKFRWHWKFQKKYLGIRQFFLKIF